MQTYRSIRRVALYAPAFALVFGALLVVMMYSRGGLGAPFPANYAGLAGYALISYALISGGVIDLRSDPYGLVHEMIAGAKKSITLFVGTLHPSTYLAVSGGVSPASLLVRKAAGNVKVSIITQWDPNPETLEAMRCAAQQRDIQAVRANLKLLQLPASSRVSREHFMVVDNKRVRIEAEHDRDGTNHSNRYVRYSLYLHAVLNREFAALAAMAEERALL